MTHSDREKKSRGVKAHQKEALKNIEELTMSAYHDLHDGHIDSAKEMLKHALKLAEEKADIVNPELKAVVLTYLGQAERLNFEHESSIAHLSEAVALCQKSGALNCEVQARLFLAEQLTATGEFSQAKAQFELAYTASTYLKDPPAMELAAGNLGSVEMSRCHLEAAADWFNIALDLSESTDSGEKSTWLGSLGLALSELGQFEQSVNYYRRAYLEAEQEADRLAMSICRGSEGNVRFEEKRYAEALPLYEEAERLALLSGYKRRSGIWMGNQGVTLCRMGDVASAVTRLENALVIARELEDKATEAAHLDSLGDCHKANNNQELAGEFYSQALALSRSISDRLGERVYLTNLGKLKGESGQLAPAFEFFRDAIELFDEQRGLIKADDLKTSFANRGQELYRDMVSTCLKLNKRVEALEYVGRAKSRALLDLLSNSPIDVSELTDALGGGTNLKTLIQREADLRAQIAHLERQFFHGNNEMGGDASGATGTGGGGGSGNADQKDNSDGSQLRRAQPAKEDTHKLYLEWREVLNQLRRRHPNYANLVSASTLNYDEIQALWNDGRLDDKTCVVEFFFPDDYLLVACVQKAEQGDGLTTHVIMDPGELEYLREDLSSFLEMSSTEGWEVPTSLCKRLFEQLLKPVLANLNEKIERLLVVPHSSLYHLPFAALHTGRGYLCQQYAVSYLPTVSLIPVLTESHSIVDCADSVASIGSAGVSARDGAESKNKNMSKNTNKNTSMNKNATVNSASSRLVPEVESRYLVSAISDYSATRESGMVFSSRLRSSAGLEDLAYTMEEANSILSLGQATAGSAMLITNEQVKNSFPEMFGQYEVVHFAGHAVFNHEEPMASGLVLSDGTILSAASILEGNALRTKLGKLLVLSACQTGVNVVTQGGEILGLARALMYAGMPNLVLSLWEVADRSTAMLMQDFHTSYGGGKTSVSQALREAQLKAIEAKQPVHAWAPFIHFGVE
jgi:CHAT domain-containing protein/Tfp pilus assembly protein PilF